MISSASAREDTTFVIGGARSGKSVFAERCAIESGLRKIYVATAQAWDDEMRSRIATHKERRGPDWTTIEAPQDLTGTIDANCKAGAVVLIDCLTLWLNTLIMAEDELETSFDALKTSVSNATGALILVSNEVGLGIVPENALARRFRDAQGQLNQIIAAVSDNVYFVAAGLPITLKDRAPLTEYKLDYQI